MPAIKILHLTELSLADNALGTSNVLLLAQVLWQYGTLEKLDVSNNSIDDTAADELCCNLASCRNLEDVDLSWNLVHSSCVSELTAVYAKCRLTALNVSHNGLGSVKRKATEARDAERATADGKWL